MSIILHRHHIEQRMHILAIQVVDIVPEKLQDCQHGRRIILE